MKPKILLRDRNFCVSHEPFKNFGNLDFEVDWDNNKTGYITVFSDFCLNTVDSCNSRIKIAWLVEPPEIVGFAYDFIHNNWAKFDYVLTFCRDLLSIDDRFHFCPFGTTWFGINDWDIYDKSKNLSIIASNKNFATGHKLRHEIIKKFGNSMDVMGSGYTPIPDKLLGLKDYRYSLAVENSYCNDYFTEKLIDCFLTGTIPIYYGFDNIGKYFDNNGFISFNSSEDLEQIIRFIGPEDYSSRLSSITANFHAAKKFASLGDNLWEYFFKKFLQKYS